MIRVMHNGDHSYECKFISERGRLALSVETRMRLEALVLEMGNDTSNESILRRFRSIQKQAYMRAYDLDSEEAVVELWEMKPWARRTVFNKLNYNLTNLLFCSCSRATGW
jgi:hypothetical protein